MTLASLCRAPQRLLGLPLLLVLLVGSASAQSPELPLTFEENVDYAVRGFEGADDSQIVDDPFETGNRVVRVMRSADAQTFAGTVIADNGLDSAIPFAQGATTLSVRVWTPAAGTVVRLKVEDNSDATVSVETEATSTVGMMYETLVFDFANEAAGTSEINFGSTYDQLAIFFDFGTAGEAGGTYYFDDIAFGNGASGNGDTDLVITGILDGPLQGGTPKALELYVINDIADLSVYGIDVAANGGGSDGAAGYTFPAGSASAGDFLYLATEAPQFTAFFGFAPDYADVPLFVNGDDAVELYRDGAVVDVVGDPDTDGTGQPWEYMDGWAYRMDGAGPSATFDADDFTYSGVDALDGETTNATASTPFPTASYDVDDNGGGGGMGNMLVVTTSADEDNTNGQCSLREAVRAANGDSTGGDCGNGADDGDRITFAPTVMAPIALTMGEITITDDVTIDGSGLTNRVTVDGQGNSRIFDVSADVDDVFFTSLILQNGDSRRGSSAAPDAGGAVDLKAGASATFTDVDVIGSGAGINGGGIHGAGDTDIVITTTDGGSSLISRNRAFGAEAGMGGGGVWGAGTVTITGNVTIDRNRATGAAGSGGGVFNFGGTLVIDGATISRNSANRAGGGIEDFGDDDDDTDVTLTNVTLSENAISNAAPGNGGGFHSGGGDAVITGGLVTGNVAVEGGGLWSSGTITVTGTAITRNTGTGDEAANGGGGFYSEGSTATFSEVGFEDNRATGTSGSGGNVLVNGGTFTMTGGELDEGHANRAGGGIEIAAGTATLNDVSVTMNDAGANPGNGGGLHAGGNTTVTVNGGRFTENTAIEGGALWSADVLNVNGTGIKGNTATGTQAIKGGGGLFNQAGTITLTDVIFEENTAVEGSGSGGAIFNNGGTLTMTGGEVDENRSARAGGGVEVASGTVTLNDVSVWMNDAGSNPGNGGGLHAGGNTDVTVTGVRMSENTAVEGAGLWSAGVLNVDDSAIYLNVATGDDADKGGGAFYNEGGRATITGSQIYENQASGTSGSGGGILNNAGMLTVRETSFTSNTANRAGGAVEDRGGVGSMASFVKVTMTRNSTGDNPGNGGAIHVTGAGTVRIDSSQVTRNTAAGQGGGLWNFGTASMSVTYSSVNNNTSPLGGGLYQQDGEDGLLMFRNSTAANNVASIAGGGLLSDGATVQIVNSTVSGNTAPTGAGVATRGGRVQLSNATVARNEASSTGGGLANLSPDFGDGDDSDDEDADPALLSPDNTIVGDNTAPNGANLSGPIMSRGYNLFETTDGATVTMDEAAGDDITGVDAGLQPLADNGGPTRTHAISLDSPAVNVGWTALDIDQRGAERRGTPDIGAFESDAAPTAGEDVETDFADGEMMRMTPMAPNPLTTEASLSVAVRESQTVRVMLYDVMGRQVGVLHDGPMAGATPYRLNVDARGLASGVYVVVVRGESVRGTQQITVAR